MTRSCESCGRPYEARRPNSKFCGDTCRKRKQRAPDSVAPVTSVPPAVTHSALAAAIELTLIDAERLDTFQGRQALALARRIDSPHETGSAVSSLSKELRAVMDEAMKGAHVKTDPVDELRRKREQKLAAG